jgi:ankyrin repeat protein
MKRNKATFGIRDEPGEYKTKRRSTRRRLIFDSFQSEKMKKTPNNRKSKVVGEGRDRPEMPVTHIMSPCDAGQLKHQSFPPVHSRLVTPNEKERIISSKLKKTKATSVSKNNRPAENAVTPSPLKVDRSNKVKFVLDGHGRFPEELYITDKDGKDLALAGDQNYILHVASFFGIKELLDQFLPNRMGNLFSRNTAGQNPIHMATIGGSLYAVKYLINQLPRETHTKYCETINEDGRTPLLLSALHGHHHVLDYLLTSSVSERHKDNVVKTAFLLSAEGGHIASMRCIMQSVVFHQDKKENLSQALMITVSNDNQRATKFLLVAGATNENTLVMVVKQNLPEMVGLLIDFGADVNSDIDGGLSPIWMSLHKENYKMSLLLLQRGATVSESTLPFGCSIMHYIVKSQCVNLLTDCIAAGAILDLPDNQNRTPLELFLSRPWKNDFLQAYEPHWTLKGINRRNSLGKTPLHIAASVGNPVLVACLLRRGANVTAEDNQKNQPIHDAVVANDISYFHDT